MIHDTVIIGFHSVQTITEVLPSHVNDPLIQLSLQINQMSLNDKSHKHSGILFPMNVSFHDPSMPALCTLL